MEIRTLLWLIFVAIFVSALVWDLFVFQRKAHVIPVKEALWLSAFWITLALVFNVVIYFSLGTEKATEYLSTFLIEKSLSMDNLFVFLLIFTYFQVPRQYQRKVLLWGILGAIFFRGIFIFGGVALVKKFEILIYLLGALLIYTGWKMAFRKEGGVEPEKNPIVRLFRRVIPCSTTYEGGKFWSRIGGRLCATPLLVTVVCIEATDIIFAVDSVPAAIGITLDPLIIYTSNLFAILGLRALFFAIAGLFYLFHYLKYGLCFILVFIGIKMLVHEIYHIPVAIALGVVGSLIFLSILVSIIRPPAKEEIVTTSTADPEEKE